MIVCLDCREEKPAAEYHKNSATKSGLYSYCKDCSRIRTNAYRARNRKRYNAINRRAYHLRNRNYEKANKENDLLV